MCSSCLGVEHSFNCQLSTGDVNVNLSYAGYNGAVYAGINTLQVTANVQTFNAQGFCIDPYHASASGTYAGPFRRAQVARSHEPPSRPPG
jgi:hypothetical protein